MNKIIYTLLTLFSCFGYANTKIHIHDSEINISEECTYSVPETKSASFWCADNSYTISFGDKSEADASHERMIKRKQSDDNNFPLLIKAAKKKIGKYTHYYYVMSSRVDDFLFYSYVICDYDACIDVSSPEKHNILRVLGQLKLKLIPSENL